MFTLTKIINLLIEIFLFVITNEHENTLPKPFCKTFNSNQSKIIRELIKLIIILENLKFTASFRTIEMYVALSLKRKLHQKLKIIGFKPEQKKNNPINRRIAK